jgi:hypothetical protein
MFTRAVYGFIILHSLLIAACGEAGTESVTESAEPEDDADIVQTIVRLGASNYKRTTNGKTVFIKFHTPSVSVLVLISVVYI